MDLKRKPYVRRFKTCLQFRVSWSKLKKEFDDNNFDKKDVNTHQAHSYMLRLQHQKNTITPGTSQPEVFNVLGQIDTLERVIRDKELQPPVEKKKLKK